MTLRRVSSLPTRWGHLPSDVGLERFLIVIMLKLCCGPCRLLPNRSGRIAFGPWNVRTACFECLVPAGRTSGVRPTILGFKKSVLRRRE